MEPSVLAIGGRGGRRPPSLAVDKSFPHVAASWSPNEPASKVANYGRFVSSQKFANKWFILWHYFYVFKFIDIEHFLKNY